MAHSKWVTIVFRHNRYVTSTFAILNDMDRDFIGPQGIKRLSTVLGVSRRTASRVMAREATPNMHRLAYYYGYMPNEDSDSYRALPMHDQPFDAGPALRWNDRLIDYLREVFGNPAGRPSVSALAWRMDSTESRLKRVIRQHRIYLSEVEAEPMAVSADQWPVPLV